MQTNAEKKGLQWHLFKNNLDILILSTLETPFLHTFPVKVRSLSSLRSRFFVKYGILKQCSKTDNFSLIYLFQPYFSGTRSLSPMSSLFGSIWTPQSEPYQNHFHPERSAPVSPHSPISPVAPVAPFSREPGGACPGKQYSSFNPFGPHMNLDIWNSSSNRSSNSQLSNDSGYCGEM